jgi:signal transduction histidine kinase
MQDQSTQGIIIFIAGTSFLLLLLISFIISIAYKYQQKQNIYFKDIEALKTSHENTLLQSQLEIQEQTLQNISREIHDNIGQKLTLAKLYLNTFNFNERHIAIQQVGDSVNIIGEAIKELSDLSRSMSSEIILNNGPIKAVEFEAAQLAKTGLYKINFSVTGSPVFLDTNTELILFRIVQEVLNNIVKHAAASAIDINLHYDNVLLTVQINDDGKGFDTTEARPGTGLQNIKKRAAMLKGHVMVNSSINMGTKFKIEIPYYENIKAL